MNKLVKRLLTGTLALATILTALPVTAVHASGKSTFHNLYSDVQRADDVVVVLPAKAGEKHFLPEQKVKLINPRITTDGYKIGERGFVNYILLADDMLPAESK